MKILVVGSPDSGKSALAEKLAVSLAENGPKLYIATMIPYGKEGEARVRKHRKMREGKGFFTIECPRKLGDISVSSFAQATGLLECMSNLVGNEMYSEDNRTLSQEALADLICAEVTALGNQLKNLVIVTNEFEAPAPDQFDEETRNYIALTHMVNERLAKEMDQVYQRGEDGNFEETV